MPRLGQQTSHLFAAATVESRSSLIHMYVSLFDVAVNRYPLPLSCLLGYCSRANSITRIVVRLKICNSLTAKHNSSNT